MGNTKFQILTGLFVVIVAVVGFFAMRSLRNPETYIRDSADDTIGELRGEGEELPTTEPAGTGAVPDTAPTGTQPTGTTGTTGTTTTTTLKYADLISKLEKAKSAGIVYKVGSKGESVGAIQEFLNVYENKTVKADNDYGAGTATRVKAYQGANQLPVTGQTAEKTLTKMIEWLKAKG